MIGKRYLNKRKAQSAKRKTITQNSPAPAGSRLAFLSYWRESLIFTFCVLRFAFPCYAEENKVQPIIVNGDTVEYSTDSKEVIATGNVEVNYKGTKLTCQKLTVNTQTKEGTAEGNARLDDAKGVIEGAKIIYNFEKKSGTIIDSQFRANPYFGKAQKTEKVSDAQFTAINGYFTTCSLDYPHYRIKSKQIDLFPQDKVQTKGNAFYLGKVPLLYLPKYNRSLKDPAMHVQFMPGKSKQWGPFLLTAWRYNLTEHISGRIYLDYRDKLGVAEGFGANYQTANFGKGDFKYYYTQERDMPRGAIKKSALKTRPDPFAPRVFQRYFVRWRHKWDLDEKTNLTSEYYKIVDAKRALLGTEHNFLKDYFFREYEKDTQPRSYALLHHAFNYSSLDLLMQKRTNRWYDSGYMEKLPEIKYSLFSVEILQTPFYFDSDSSVGNFNKKNTSTSTPADNDTRSDVHVNRLDTTNRISLPMRVWIFQVKPFVSNRETFYDKDASGASLAPRTIFYTGTDLSTKFYRIFNVKSKFLGMDVNGLRHIITPTIAYSYNHEPTISSGRVRQIDGVDSINTSNNSAALGLSNKLQTKRQNQTVDIVDFMVTNNYVFKPKTGKRGSNLSDFLFYIKVLPFSWMSINLDATYKHSGSRSEEGYNRFSNINYDLTFNLGKERSLGIGQRYQRKGSNEMTALFQWRLTPKWKFSVYERYERGYGINLKRGLREQEYIVSRDLHCWTTEVTYNVKRGIGEAIWLIFRLKAFPEMEFEFNESYHAPKPGSQPNQ